MLSSRTLTRLSLALAMSAFGALAAEAASGPAPQDMMPDSAPSAGKSGTDPAYYMPSDPHLSSFDIARATPFAGGKSLDGLNYEQVAAIENALIHPSLEKERAALITRSLDKGI
ncbi:hypothetical protein [Thioclava pacifica]|uniref:Uncharacterized protein n=1 Tax=Thioclava pacifica DSM 10166 TaxID=1353537 RepID=A0A074J4T3_9RHOB|nr:hypothetical protein [Thioclava pacifica]KEO51524.1 hypothetical protein TP2_11560 [Thioclava pacifica DSM 10166]